MLLIEALNYNLFLPQHLSNLKHQNMSKDGKHEKYTLKIKLYVEIWNYEMFQYYYYYYFLF
jgi:hypothetical protein